MTDSLWASLTLQHVEDEDGERPARLRLGPQLRRERFLTRSSAPHRIPPDRTFLVWPLVAKNVQYLHSDKVPGGSVPGILSVYMQVGPYNLWEYSCYRSAHKRLKLALLLGKLQP